MKLWIARDFSGGLYLFPEKPTKLVEIFLSNKVKEDEEEK